MDYGSLRRQQAAKRPSSASLSGLTNPYTASHPPSTTPYTPSSYTPSSYNSTPSSYTPSYTSPSSLTSSSSGRRTSVPSQPYERYSRDSYDSPGRYSTGTNSSGSASNRNSSSHTFPSSSTSPYLPTTSYSTTPRSSVTPNRAISQPSYTPATNGHSKEAPTLTTIPITVATSPKDPKDPKYPPTPIDKPKYPPNSTDKAKYPSTNEKAQYPSTNGSSSESTRKKPPNPRLDIAAASGLSGRALSASLNNSDAKNSLSELKGSLEQMQNLTESRVTESRESRVSSSNISNFRSINSSTNLAENALARGFNGLELPSLGGPSSDEIDCDMSEVRPSTVTSPLGTVEQLDHSDLGSDGSSERSGLTSPNLVSTLGGNGLTLSNASPLSKMSMMPAMSGGMGMGMGMGMGSGNSSSIREERKSSSSKKSSKTVVGRGGDVSVTEDSTSALESSNSSRLERDGIVAEKESGIKHNSRTHRVNDTMQHESATAAMSANRLHGGGFSTENATAAAVTSKSKLDADGKFTSSTNASKANSKKMSSTVGGVTTSHSLLNSSQISQIINTKMEKDEINKYLTSFDDLDRLGTTTNVKDVENAMVKYCGVMANMVDTMKEEKDEDSLTSWLSKVSNMMVKARGVPRFGQDIGETLCDIMKNNGGVDLVIDNLGASHAALQFNSAKVLSECLNTDNKNYVVEKGLNQAVAVANKYGDGMVKDVTKTRVGTLILENLFNHSEGACGDVIALGGLDTVLNECQSVDIETLRHCAGALANAAMYGGSENQEQMVKRKVPNWLFPLSVHKDEMIKYYACLAISFLAHNKEIEAAVLKTKTLDRVETFLQTKNPVDFAETYSNYDQNHGSGWLERLLPVLTSNREEAKNLAAFHFCMEAEIKVKQGKEGIFKEIGAITALKKVASSPNGIASKYAAQALRIIGEEVPHKLSQQVPTWEVDDVKEWVKQIGFPQFAESFVESRVDGDLLLQLTEEMLREDIQMRNGILRRRFLRELSDLRKKADYSKVDPTGLNDFLCQVGPEYPVYTYDMLKAGIDRETLLLINDEQLLVECGITNKIHRLKIQQGVKVERGDISYSEEMLDKNNDVFISYRRSNGSQLASLLKVHLELKDYTVFLDVQGLEAGKFDNNLLQNIRTSRNFILVCTLGAMDRCEGDVEQKDWIHKEVACALNSQCTIIPVFDNFAMPEPDKLPETMRVVTSYNGVRWIHDYQEACVNKIVKFMGGDVSVGGPLMDRFLSSSNTGSQYSYRRTISQDSNAASTRSDDTFTNGSLQQ